VALGNLVAEVLAALANSYPGAAESFSSPRRAEQLLKQLTAAFPGVEYLTADEARTLAPEAARPEAEPYPGVIVAAQKVLYLRLDSFGQKAVDKAREDVESAARLVRPPLGVVLDLRDCAGHDYAGAGALLRLFRRDAPDLALGGEAPALPAAKPVAMPVIVLVGGKTAGAAEVFAGLLERAGNALTMGQRTAGRPFARKQVPLDRGDMLFVPDVPPAMRTVPPTAVEPAVDRKSVV
jgi:C-terminal processing protease CtpA/Prc